MEYIADSDHDVCVLRFHQGEDFLPTLKETLEKLGITSGVVVTGIGMLLDFELGYFDGESYSNRTFAPPHELCTMQGTIAIKEGTDEILPHIHATLAGPDHGVVGGHLHRAKVGVLCELVVLRLNEKTMKRKHDPETDLWTLSLVK